ncbi:MAG: lysozyme, partial [Rickettsiales bacterium]|nr:lysozyme [Rickettsiales bacterium]
GKFFTHNDGKDIPTIGYGHKIKPGESFPYGITEQQAEGLLRQDIKIAENDYMKLIGRTDYSQNKIDGIISFLYNTGGGSKVANSNTINMLKNNLNVNPQNGKTLSQEFMEWVSKGTSAEKGLINRRNKEWEFMKKR